MVQNTLDDMAGSIWQTLSYGDNADNDRLLRLYGRGLRSSTFQPDLSRFGHTSPCPPV